MTIKLFELRDSMTFIPIICIAMNHPSSIEEIYLLRRCGYPIDSDAILMTRASGDGHRAFVDPYDWNDRTYKVAHNYITERWNDLRSGQVIDVEFILGETPVPKKSEMEA